MIRQLTCHIKNNHLVIILCKTWVLHFAEERFAIVEFGGTDI